MNVTIVDESLTVTQAAQRVLGSAGVPFAVAASLADVRVGVEATESPDVLVVNLSDTLTGWDVAAHVRRTGYQGRLLAFADSVGNPGARHLARLANARCVARPRADGLLDAALRQALPDLPPPAAVVSPDGPAVYHGIVGDSPRMREIFARIEKVAAGDANVCIYGESGTGKELIARAIHYASPRRDKPLITLDCTTVPEGLMESHLLGHVKGAFTGAVETRPGVFSLAHTGTLFIDELSELSLPLQAKLLRVIQNREFVRVGGSKPIRSDIRLIIASNKDLKQEVDKGTFREDLYYRVAVVMITVPPLRERREDLPLLVDHFLQKFAARYGKPLRGLDPRAMKRLLALPWPGNVRQLEHCLEQAVVLADGDTLTERDLFAAEPPPPAPVADVYEPGLPLHEVERRHILNTLQKVGGHRTEAARLLGISVRTLQYKLKEYAEHAEHSDR